MVALAWNSSGVYTYNLTITVVVDIHINLYENLSHGPCALNRVLTVEQVAGHPCAASLHFVNQQ